MNRKITNYCSGAPIIVTNGSVGVRVCDNRQLTVGSVVGVTEWHWQLTAVMSAMATVQEKAMCVQ